jgi:C-terminal processing protease CtpA/Prc
MQGGQVGYLGILSFHQYTADDDLPEGLACIRAAGDAVFAKTGAVKGFIVDVRSNGGGEDAFVLELASRLTDRRYLAFGKQARITSAKTSGSRHLMRFLSSRVQVRGTSARRSC